MRKLISWLLVAMMLGSCLSGCGSSSSGAQRTVQIPANGIIAKSVFEGIRDSDDFGIFNGNNNDITYQWLFIGSLIEEPEDMNLKVNFSSSHSSTVKSYLKAAYVQELSFETENPLAGHPTLSIYLADIWDAASVELYSFDLNSNKATLLATAALENSPNAIITYIPQDFKGLFYLVGKSEAPGNTLGTDSNQSSQNTGSDQPLVELDDTYTGAGVTGSTGSTGEKDKYLTDPTPAGRPAPVEPEDVTVNTAVRYTCTLSIRCDTILDNMNICEPNKVSQVPGDGAIMITRTCVFYEGENVFDVLQRECRSSGIHMSFKWTPIYNSVYVQGIHNLYEFDVGENSGWMYKVNGWFPNYGASRYHLQNGDVIEWIYTCDLGRDIGGFYAIGDSMGR